MKNFLKNFLLFLLIFLVIAGLFSMYSPSQKQEKVDIGTFIQQLKSQEVASVVIRNTQLEVLLVDETEEIVSKELSQSFGDIIRNYSIDPEILNNVKIEVKENEGLNFWMATLLPFLIPFLLIGGFIYFMMRQVQGANSRAMMFGLVERKYDIYVAKGLDKIFKVCYNDISRSKTNSFTTFKYYQCKERGIANNYLL